MPTENSVITREHLPGLLLARTIWENGGPSLYFPPALQDATDQARAALPAPVSVPDGYMPIPTAEQLADALENVRCYHDMSAELIAPELLANLLATPTVKESLSVAPSLPAAGSADQQYPDGIADDLERSDWTPIEALQWYAAGKHFDVADGRTRIIDTGAVASNALKHASLAYLELKGDAELSELRAVLSAQQSVQPEFCCEHSYKVAKQAAWGARDLTQCKCDHNEYCEHCWPDDFREGGKWHGGLETKQSAHVSVPAEDWSIFAGYLVDKCEGYEVSEENVQCWLSEMLADPHYGALFRREKQPHGMPSAIELAIEAKEEEHGSLRAAAKAIGVDAGYLSRLKNGQKLNPGDDVLTALGLERVTTYRALLNGGEA